LDELTLRAPAAMRDHLGDPGWRELQVVAARLLGQLPQCESETIAATTVVPTSVNGNGTGA
jgi:hypothetical protein